MLLNSNQLHLKAGDSETDGSFCNRLEMFFRQMHESIEDGSLLIGTHATSQEEIDQIAEQNGRMRDVAEVVRHMGLIRTLRWIYDDYWRAKRDRWDEDEYVRDEGIAIGEARGRAAGKAEAVLQLLNILGEVPAELTERIKSERDTEILDRWHLSAAKADSIPQFRERENL